MKGVKTERRTKWASGHASPTILVVAPHPDDELVSTAGTIVRFLSAGYRVCCVILTQGERGGATGEIRSKEAVAALKSLGVGYRDIHFGPFKDGEIPYTIETIRFLEEFASSEVITAFIPPVEDSHQDPHNTARSCLAALRRVPSLLSYKTPSAIGFVADVFFDITDQVDAKWAALELHVSQVKQRKAFMEYTAMSRDAAVMGLPVGSEFAEGFKAIRYRVDPCPVFAARANRRMGGEQSKDNSSLVAPHAKDLDIS